MNESNNVKKTLYSSDTFYPQDPMDVVRLEEGELYVYIVPIVKGNPGKRVLLCELHDTDAKRMIPSLVYEDLNHRQMRLLFQAKGEQAVISIYPKRVTSVLHKNFLLRVGITTYEEEGYESSLSEFYNRESLKEEVFIEKGKKADPNARSALYSVVHKAFQEESPIDLSGTDYYQALQYVCNGLGIDLIDTDKLHARYGKNPDVNEIARASHFICRKVVLDADWFKSDCGGFVGVIENEVIGCVPDNRGRYQIFRSSDKSISVLTADLATQISPEAYSIGRTLPLRKLTKKDVIDFCKKSITPRDITPYILLSILCALIGVLLPTLNQMVYDDYIPIGNIGNLSQICIVLLTFMTGNIFFSIVKNLFSFRITSRVGIELQNAAYHRLFHLPESFFRAYDSADLASRVGTIGETATSYVNTLVITSITALFSVFSLLRMFTYSSKLTWIGLGMYLGYTLFVVLLTTFVRKGEERIAEAEAASSSKLYQYLNGVDKIRMAGVEERAILAFMQPYSRQQSEEIKVNRLVSINEALGSIIGSIFSMVLYLVIVKSKIDLSVGTFVAFTSAFGALTGALDELVNQSVGLFEEKTVIERFWPIFEATPEDSNDREVPGPLTGALSLEHVTFSYTEGGKKILNNLDFSVKPGEYIGIVGSSGCGKSTLLKLILGFETPQSGMVLIDKKDLKSLDKSAYRRQLGVVLQNGKLISGSIFENITIAAPETPISRVNDIIEMVGLKADIENMPMGIHTMLSENCNTISGGQQQRILIARAICGNPKILIFDEATSALDNLTQAAVSESLDKMDVTRIVVAHRLSTIKNCDRILVMKDGEIVEEGNYKKLMEQKGLFYALASRQIAE